MYMILRFATGRVEAVLLQATRERMKVIVKDQDDTLELSLIGSQWQSETGSPVEIESIVSGDPTGYPAIWAESTPLAARAVS